MEPLDFNFDSTVCLLVFRQPKKLASSSVVSTFEIKLKPLHFSTQLSSFTFAYSYAQFYIVLINYDASGISRQHPCPSYFSPSAVTRFGEKQLLNDIVELLM